MKFQRALRGLMCEAWYADKTALAAVIRGAAATVAYLEAGRLTINLAEGDSGDGKKPRALTTAPVSVAGSIAVVALHGVFGTGWDEWEKSHGAIDSAEVARILRGLANDPRIDGIVLDIDSPGGLVIGTPELAEAVGEVAAQKPVFAHTAGLLASAAYYVAAGATAIYASKSALVGSIGVYMPITDISGLYEKLGIKVELFTSGPLKGAGYPGVALSDEQRADFQDHINHAFQSFSEHVKLNRKAIEDTSMLGQVFWADQALARGLVDSLASLEKTIEDCANFAASYTNQPSI